MLERNYNKKRAGAEVNSVPALGDGGVPRRLPQEEDGALLCLRDARHLFGGVLQYPDVGALRTEVTAAGAVPALLGIEAVEHLDSLTVEDGQLILQHAVQEEVELLVRILVGREGVGREDAVAEDGHYLIGGVGAVLRAYLEHQDDGVFLHVGRELDAHVAAKVVAIDPPLAPNGTGALVESREGGLLVVDALGLDVHDGQRYNYRAELDGLGHRTSSLGQVVDGGRVGLRAVGSDVELVRVGQAPVVVPTAGLDRPVQVVDIALDVDRVGVVPTVGVGGDCERGGCQHGELQRDDAVAAVGNLERIDVEASRRQVAVAEVVDLAEAGAVGQIGVDWRHEGEVEGHDAVAAGLRLEGDLRSCGGRVVGHSVNPGDGGAADDVVGDVVDVADGEVEREDAVAACLGEEVAVDDAAGLVDAEDGIMPGVGQRVVADAEGLGGAVGGIDVQGHHHDTVGAGVGGKGVELDDGVAVGGHIGGGEGAAVPLQGQRVVADGVLHLRADVVIDRQRVGDDTVATVSIVEGDDGCRRVVGEHKSMIGVGQVVLDNVLVHGAVGVGVHCQVEGSHTVALHFGDEGP